MIVKNLYHNELTSIRRLARAFVEPISTVGRWVGPEKKIDRQRRCPVSGNTSVRSKVQALCNTDGT